MPRFRVLGPSFSEPGTAKADHATQSNLETSRDD